MPVHGDGVPRTSVPWHAFTHVRTCRVRAHSDPGQLVPDHQHCWAPPVHVAMETLTPEVLMNAGVPQPRQPSQGLSHPTASAGSGLLTTAMGRPVGLPSPHKPAARARGETRPTGTPRAQAWVGGEGSAGAMGGAGATPASQLSRDLLSLSSWGRPESSSAPGWGRAGLERTRLS